jgi:hypothetical protein
VLKRGSNLPIVIIARKQTHTHTQEDFHKNNQRKTRPTQLGAYGYTRGVCQLHRDITYTYIFMQREKRGGEGGKWNENKVIVILKKIRERNTAE